MCTCRSLVVVHVVMAELVTTGLGVKSVADAGVPVAVVVHSAVVDVVVVVDLDVAAFH